MQRSTGIGTGAAAGGQVLGRPAARVAAGALAEKVLAGMFDCDIVAWVSDVGDIGSAVDEEDGSGEKR